MTRSDNERGASSRRAGLLERIPLRGFLLVATSLVLSVCDGPTAVRNRTLVVIGASPSLLVHEHALFTARVVDDNGLDVAVPQPPVWTSSDPTVASVASTGVVTGIGRGNAAITVRVGSSSATVTLRVRARVRIALDGTTAWSDPMLAVGDSLRLTARYVDVDGAPINETPSATWASSNPAGVSVSTSGLVVAVQANSYAVITASTTDGADTAHVSVIDFSAGPPPTIRFAHAAPGVGPVTFLPGEGAPVTLSFGESVERPILSGFIQVETEGFPAGQPAYQDAKSWAGMIRPGDHLSLYAVGDTTQMFLTATWASPASVPPDSAFVRLVQGSDFEVVYLRPTDAPMTGLPEQCYFDPASVTSYYRRPAGDFDVIFQAKADYAFPSGPELARVHVTAPAGHAVTYVLIGGTPQSVGVLAFPDP